MDSRHIVKNAHVSVRKVRTFLPAVKKLTPVEALTRLEVLPHSAARFLASAIKTAIVNAESALKVSRSMLEFRSLQADQGMVLKRFRAGSRGTAKPIKRRMTHITVVLSVKKAQSVVESQMTVEKKNQIEEKPKKETKIEQKTVEKKPVRKPRKPAVKKLLK